MKPLTPTEDRFVTEYLIDLNGTQAYMRASPGVKEPTARVQASRLLAKPNILGAVDKAKDARTERALAWAAKPRVQ